MAFGELFDGYCVVHAEHATGNRRPWFEKELRRRSIDQYDIVYAPEILDDDVRLKAFSKDHRSANARVSLVDAMVECLDTAKRNRWKTVAIMEDDIVFRDQFDEWWDEVEDEVCRYEWDILFLYRVGIPAESGARTHLVPIPGTLRTHCFIVREGYFSTYKAAIEHSTRRGRSLDTASTSKYLRNNSDCRIVATSRNLAGQKGDFKSSINGRIGSHHFNSVYGITKNPA